MLQIFYVTLLYSNTNEEAQKRERYLTILLQNMR